jgi:hypothetical protein
MRPCAGGANATRNKAATASANWPATIGLTLETMSRMRTGLAKVGKWCVKLALKSAQFGQLIQINRRGSGRRISPLAAALNQLLCAPSRGKRQCKRAKAAACNGRHCRAGQGAGQLPVSSGDLLAGDRSQNPSQHWSFLMAECDCRPSEWYPERFHGTSWAKLPIGGGKSRQLAAR